MNTVQRERFAALLKLVSWARKACTATERQFIGAQQPGAQAVRLQPGGMQSIFLRQQVTSQSHTVRVPHSYS
jgi:hypothetical protein